MIAALAALLLGLSALAAPTDPVQLLALDLGQEGLRIDEDLSPAYRKACQSYTPVCGYKTWYATDGSDIHKAAAALAPQCEKGDAIACLVVGWELTQVLPGRPSNRAIDPAGGARKLQTACDTQLSRACWELARLALYGVGVKPDPQAATAVLKTECSRGDLHSCASLGQLYAEGTVLARDPAEALSLLQSACDGGEPHGCAGLSAMYARGLGVKPNPEKAAALAVQACDRGVLAACTSVGVMKIKGIGLPEAPEEGLALLEATCAQHTPACTALGTVRAEGPTGDLEAAKILWSRGCEGGAPESCTRLGEAQRDPTDKLTAFDRACKLGHGPGCEALADLYAGGTGVSRDLTRARELMAQACQRGTATACHKRAAFAGDAGEASSWLRRGCTLGSADACGELGTAMAQQGREADAAKLFDDACNRAVPSACTQLGILYASGTGVAPDPDRAFALFTRACEGSELHGCLRLGGMHAAGVGTPRDPLAARALFTSACNGGLKQGCQDLGMSVLQANPARSAELFGIACEGNIADGCSALGDLIRHGVGVAANPQVAHQLYRKSCTLGSMKGCVLLGTTFLDGTGIEASSQKAAILFSQACANGEAVACEQMGILHAAGNGVRKDKKEAKMLFARGCELGQASACGRRK